MVIKVAVVVERDPESNAFIATPVKGILKGIIVGEGLTPEEAIEDLKSAIYDHIETFGLDNVLIKHTDDNETHSHLHTSGGLITITTWSFQGHYPEIELFLLLIISDLNSYALQNIYTWLKPMRMEIRNT